MLFKQSLWEGIRDGSVTLTFRRWKRRQVLAGRRYRTAAGMLEVTSVETIEPDAITDGEARRSGYPSAAAVIADFRGDPSLPVYRIAFRLVDEPDPRSVLAETQTLTPDDVAELERRLARFDKASAHGPWTRETLEIIAANPGRRAGDLAVELGREREPLKIDVRKLKNLGLTISLEVGYRLSPRGQAFLKATDAK